MTYRGGESIADFTYDYAAALRDGVCRALVFPLHGGDAEWISRDGRAMQASFETGLAPRHESERLRTALTQPIRVGDVLQKAHLRLLAVRAAGQRDAGGLVAAMNQDHARFIADLMRRRIGIEPAVVVSDLDDASRRITAFARSRDPWIVAVHMVSEGVDIPRLRVGVFASNVVTEMYFRQFCGRFVRTTGAAGEARDAFVFVPDDHRIRALAARITLDVRTGLRERADRVEGAEGFEAPARESGEAGLYTSVAAHAVEGRTLDLGPLFDPEALWAVPAAPVPPVASAPGSPGRCRSDHPRRAQRTTSKGDRGASCARQLDFRGRSQARARHPQRALRRSHRRRDGGSARSAPRDDHAVVGAQDVRRSLVGVEKHPRRVLWTFDARKKRRRRMRDDRARTMTTTLLPAGRRRTDRGAAHDDRPRVARSRSPFEPLGVERADRPRSADDRREHLLRTRRRAAAAAQCPHGRLALCVLPRFCRHHGGRPRGNTRSAASTCSCRATLTA